MPHTKQIFNECQPTPRFWGAGFAHGRCQPSLYLLPPPSSIPIFFSLFMSLSDGLLIRILVSDTSLSVLWPVHWTIVDISLLDLLYFMWLLTSCPAAIADMSDSSPARTEPATMVASSLEFAPGDSLLAPLTPSKLRHADWDASCVPPPTVPTWEPQGGCYHYPEASYAYGCNWKKGRN